MASANSVSNLPILIVLYLAIDYACTFCILPRYLLPITKIANTGNWSSCIQGRSYHWGLGGPRPPHQSVWPPPRPMILVIVQYSLIAIAKIFLLNAVNGRFDSFAKMYFIRVALQFYILFSRKY